MAFNIADKKWLLSLKHDDITKELIEKNFAYRYNKETKKVTPPRLQWTDEFSLAKGEYFNTTAVSKTNVGLFIFNKLIIEDLLEDVLGYWNTTITNKVLGQMEDKICKALFEDKITPEDFAEYENRLQWILAIHTMVCGSFTKKTLMPLPEITKERDKLFKENENALANGDAVTALKIEGKLLDDAKKLIKNDPGMDLYASGARGDFNNNYKTIAVMKGPIFDPITGKYKVAKNSFLEGIAKNDIPEYGSTVTMGAYPKAVGTQVGGYTVKRFYASFQNIVLGPKGSDCHSKGTIDVLVDAKSKEDCMYRYIVEGSKLVRLDDHNIDKYMGKVVKMRTPMYCTAEHICNVCFGDKPYMVGIENVGLTAGKIGSNFINLSMKSFHDTSMKLESVDPNKIIL